MSTLRLFDVCREGTHVLGPGCRYVIWTQGCENRCPGCITSESWDKNGGFAIDSIDLASDIILSKHIDGITISGGEPFLQSDTLADMLEAVASERPELTTIIFSGYTYEQLESNNWHKRLLNLTDVLIDGPYIKELNDGMGLRGSSNQHILALTNRLAPYVEIMSKCQRKIQNICDYNGIVTQIGVPRKINQINEFK